MPAKFVTEKTIAINGQTIRRLYDLHEEAIQHSGDVYVKLTDRAAFPGFVDVHVHLDKAFTWPSITNRSGTLSEAIANYHSAQASVTVGEMTERMALAVQYAIRHGTTAMRTHLDYGSSTYLQKVVHAFQNVRMCFSNDIYLEAVLMCPHDIDAESEKHIKWALREGIQLLGGAPHLSSNPRKNVEKIFDLAVTFGVDVDLHVDESDDPTVKTIKDVCYFTKQANYEGRVVAGHCTSLAAMEESEASEIIDMIYETNVGIVTLPATNLYLSGRHDRGLIRRGLTRVKQLLARNIPVAVASDNLRDPFHPFGRADLLQMVWLTSYAAHMSSEEEMHRLIDMITYIPARMMGLKNYGLQNGDRADFVILPVKDPMMLLAEMPVSREVWKNGRKICRVEESVTWYH